MSKSYCPHCGTLNDDAVFCENCGERLAQVEEPAAPPVRKKKPVLLIIVICLAVVVLTVVVITLISKQKEPDTYTVMAVVTEKMRFASSTGEYEDLEVDGADSESLELIGRGCYIYCRSYTVFYGADGSEISYTDIQVGDTVKIKIMGLVSPPVAQAVALEVHKLR